MNERQRKKAERSRQFDIQMKTALSLEKPRIYGETRSQAYARMRTHPAIRRRFLGNPLNSAAPAFADFASSKLLGSGTYPSRTTRRHVREIVWRGDHYIQKPLTTHRLETLQKVPVKINCKCGGRTGHRRFGRVICDTCERVQV